MTGTKADYHAGGPTAEDRRQAQRLQEILRELDAMRQGLENDAAHNAAWAALTDATAAIVRAQDALLLEE